MKNSDMKIIAIILCIALFITVITSNAVSVASVVFLAKGSTTEQTGTATNGGQTGTNGGSVDANAGVSNDGSGDVVVPDNSGSVTPDASTPDTATPDASTPDASASDNGSSSANTATNSGAASNSGSASNSGAASNSGTASNSGSASNSGASNSGTASNGNTATNNGTSNSGSASNGGSANTNTNTNTGAWDKVKTFNFYKAACDKITSTGAAGHTRKEWQEVQSLDLGSASSMLQPILQGFMKTEDQAEAKTSAKGSDDAKRRMAPCGADISYVKSATKQDLANGNYKITIIMNDENTPAKGSNGIASMSTGILYVEDVQDTVKNDSTVNKIVKSLDKAEIVYKAYTIVAEMTKDGKFVSIDHNTVGNISADCKLVVGSVSGSGTLAFTSKWYDFKY